jgi:acyl-coenzyme A thioesterase PaaI-like protein
LKSAAVIRARVLRGIALNRTPGFHFPGNFLDVSFDRVALDGTRLTLDPGPWCADAAGEADFGATALLADLALGSCVRAQLTREVRVATVSLALQFTGAPRTGRLEARGEFQGFFENGAGRLGLGRVTLGGSAGQICHGTGSFMVLRPPKGVTLHPVPLRSRKSAPPPALKEKDLTAQERGILAQADAALAKCLHGGSFINHFWSLHARGGTAALANGLHVGNRVGHAQGGILLALAASSAASGLPENFRLSGLSAYYISPGDAKTLRASSSVVHQGRLTAVVRTRITGKNRRAVLEVVTTHMAV